MNNTAIAQIRKLQTGENRYCFECQTGSPTWASLPYGIYLCYNCSGFHRGIGVHLTFVRSIDMDSWTEKQLAMMHLGGNQQLRVFFQSHGIQITDSNKWKTNAAHYYREKMRALVNETQMPEEPEDWTAIQETPKPQIPQQSQIQQDPPSTQEQQNFWEQASKSTKDAFAIIDDKISKVQIKEEAAQIGQQITAKTKQIGEKSTKIADKAYKSLKSGFNEAFGFIKSKTDQVIGKEKQIQPEQQQQQQQQQQEQQQQQQQQVQQQEQQQTNNFWDNQQQLYQFQIETQNQKEPQDLFSFENTNHNNYNPPLASQNQQQQQQQQINIMDYSDYFIDDPTSIITQETPKYTQQINQQDNLIDFMQDVKQPQQISVCTPNLLDL